MAKGSYLAKHAKQSLENDEPYQKLVLPYVSINEESKLLFEQGKVLLIDKPLHWTSFDVVRKIRSTIKIKKVGHAGTLDPLATGLLIICTGKYTKKINEFMAQPKEYTGCITIGATTPTYDKESNTENHKNYDHITVADVEKATQQFVGEIEQFPPIYSAIKKDGEALYELARRGETVELKARPITIYSFEITAVNLPNIYFKVLCSTGTYIRSLANDVGAVLGCGGYLTELKRTKIGEQNVTEAQTLEQFLLSINEVKKDS